MILLSIFILFLFCAGINVIEWITGVIFKGEVREVKEDGKEWVWQGFSCVYLNVDLWNLIVDQYNYLSFHFSPCFHDLS